MRRLRVPLIPSRSRWGVVLAVAGVILYYSIQTGPGTGTFQTGPLGLFPYSDWLHFLAYACLAVMLAYALHDARLSDWQVFVLVLMCAVGYGVGIELLQSRLPSRTFAIEDMGVNAVGAAVAVVCWRLLVRYARFYRAARPADLEPPIS
ncbi:VanZ family protein [Halorubrum trueperi]|uniref:VanZ family protein n=1 Tax=Halorubrum trueperi TaxID=2004704 RepID=A0ABD5ULP5_9EURY